MIDTYVTWIAIDGHGGSGKSCLADELAASLNATVIHVDDFTGEGSPDDWYKNVIEAVIEPAGRGDMQLNYPRAKWWPEHDPEPVINQPVAPIMILEGVGSLRKELRDYMTVKVFVDTPRDTCIQRGLSRDRGMGGKNDEEILAMWRQWIQWDDEYFAKDNPEASADVTINGTLPCMDSIERILAAIPTY